jgi:ERCC4-related helicase
MTPSVVLAYQQHSFLSQQLPAAQFKLITGGDSPEYWKSRQTWDNVLLNVDVVVCTPQILLTALDNGFVSLREVSLMVVDEAHHCSANHPLNVIMKSHYHALSSSESFSSRPAILGLSASPVTKKSISELQNLEENLGARCVAPTKQLGEYATFVNAPKLQVTTYSQKPCPSLPIFSALATIVNQLTIEHDPFVQKLRSKSGLASQEKLNKILKKNKTPAMEELHSFLRSAIDLHTVLGPWAAREYITTCLLKIQMASSEALQSVNRSEDDSLQFVCRTLEPLQTMVLQTYPDPSDAGDCSEKVGALIRLLVDEYRPTTRALIFIKTKSAAWALTRLLQAHLQTREYRPFSFVGCSNPSHRSVFDFAQPTTQNEALEDFRRGELNLCIATSVMEEGIDVPAMNLVICFDEPPNLRSFVQSRGRARQQESKFIMFQELGGGPAKLVKWRTVEEEMKLACAEEEKELEERQASEGQEEIGGEILRIPTTG